MASLIPWLRLKSLPVHLLVIHIVRKDGSGEALHSDTWLMTNMAVAWAVGEGFTLALTHLLK